jgi:hypothetical protein
MKLLGIIMDITNKLLIRFPEFVIYWRYNGSSILKKNTETLIHAGKKVCLKGLEIIVETIMYMLLYRHQIAGKIVT